MAAVHTATASRGMVVTAFPAASEAGREAFAAGGNAIDAAVAAAWALAVCEPSGSGLGGQTVALVRLASGRTVAIDGHSRAPAAVSRQNVSRAGQRAGYRATTVPTTPATLAYLQWVYGSLTLSRLLEPAVRLAEEGYELSRLQSRQLRWCRAQLAQTAAARRFLLKGRPYRAGEVFRQPELAAGLHRLGEHGAEDFYRGAIARSIAQDMRRHGGLLEARDLEEARPVAERAPISVRYRDREVVTVPPPGGGFELLLALRLLESLETDEPGQWYRCLAEATHTAFAQRELHPAHPDDPVAELEDRLRDVEPRMRACVGADREEPGETTHLCTADAQGNVVALTQSIQSLFGAKVANADYGFLYNNYLVTCPRRRHRYRLGSRCVARSNAAPTLVLSGERPVLALGAAGSRRIISSLLHVMSGVLDRGLELRDALDLPRIHSRLSGRVWLERPAATPELREALGERFAGVDLRRRRSYAMGAVQALEVRPDGTLLGAADPRRDGTARGW